MLLRAWGRVGLCGLFQLALTLTVCGSNLRIENFGGATLYNIHYQIYKDGTWAASGSVATMYNGGAQYGNFQDVYFSTVTGQGWFRVWYDAQGGCAAGDSGLRYFGPGDLSLSWGCGEGCPGWYGTNAPPSDCQTNYVTVSVRNNTASAGFYQLYQGDLPIRTGDGVAFGSGSYGIIPAGQSGVLRGLACGTNNIAVRRIIGAYGSHIDANGAYYFPSGENGGYEVALGAGEISVNCQPTTYQTNSAPGASFAGNTSPLFTNSVGTNAGIQFPSGVLYSTNSADQIQMSGFQALYKVGNDVVAQLGAVGSKIDGLAGGLSNALARGSGSGVEGFTTNALGQLVGYAKGTWDRDQTNLVSALAGRQAWEGVAGSAGAINAGVTEHMGATKDGADGQAAIFGGGLIGDSSGGSVGEGSLLQIHSGGTSYEINIDPLSNSKLAALWALVKAAFWWAATVAYYYLVIGWIIRSCNEVMLTPQAGFAHFTIFGNDVGAASVSVFVPIIMAAVAMVPQMLLNWATGAGAGAALGVRTDPLAGGQSMFSMSYAWFNACFPWAYVVGLTVSALVYRWQIFGIHMMAATAIKLCVR